MSDSTVESKSSLETKFEKLSCEDEQTTSENVENVIKEEDYSNGISVEEGLSSIDELSNSVNIEKGSLSVEVDEINHTEIPNGDGSLSMGISVDNIEKNESSTVSDENVSPEITMDTVNLNFSGEMKTENDRESDEKISEQSKPSCGDEIESNDASLDKIEKDETSENTEEFDSAKCVRDTSAILIKMGYLETMESENDEQSDGNISENNDIECKSECDKEDEKLDRAEVLELESSFENNRVQFLKVCSKLEEYMNDEPLAKGVLDELDDSDEISIFGLDFISEVCKEGREFFADCSYYCALCENTINAVFLVSHLLSAEHIWTYVRNLFPAFYEEIIQVEEEKRKSELKTFYEGIQAVVGPVHLAVVLDNNEDEVFDLMREKCALLCHLSYYDALEYMPEPKVGNTSKLTEEKKIEVAPTTKDDVGKLLEPKIELTLHQRWNSIKILMMRREYLKDNKFDASASQNITYIYSDNDSDISSKSFLQDIKKHSPENFDILILSPYDWLMDPEFIPILGVEKKSLNKDKSFIKLNNDKLESLWSHIQKVHSMLSKKYKKLKVIWTLPHPIDYRMVNMGARAEKTVYIDEYNTQVSVAQFCAIVRLMRSWFKKTPEIPVICTLNGIIKPNMWGSFLDGSQNLSFRSIIEGDRVGLGWTRVINNWFMNKVKELWLCTEIAKKNISRRNSNILIETTIVGKEKNAFGADYVNEEKEFKKKIGQKLSKLGIDHEEYNFSELFSYYWNTKGRDKLERISQRKHQESKTQKKPTSAPPVLTKNIPKKITTEPKVSKKNAFKNASPAQQISKKKTAKDAHKYVEQHISNDHFRNRIDQSIKSRLGGYVPPYNQNSALKRNTHINPGNRTHFNSVDPRNELPYVPAWDPNYVPMSCRSAGGETLHGNDFINRAFDSAFGSSNQSLKNISYRTNMPYNRVDGNDHSPSSNNASGILGSFPRNLKTDLRNDKSQFSDLRNRTSGKFYNGVDPNSTSASFKRMEASDSHMSKKNAIRSQGYSPLVALGILCETEGNIGYLGNSLRMLFDEAKQLQSRNINPMFAFQDEDHVSLIEVCSAKMTQANQDCESMQKFMLEPSMKVCQRLLSEIRKFESNVGFDLIASKQYPSEYEYFDGQQLGRGQK